MVLMHTVRTYSRAITALFILLFGLSNIRLSSSVHYCRGEIKSISLIGEAKSCHEKAIKSCHQKKASKNICHTDLSDDIACKDGCCQDEEYTAQLDYDGIFCASITTDSEAPIQYITGGLHSYINKISTLASVKSIPRYRPPPPSSGMDIRVELCSFLC